MECKQCGKEHEPKGKRGPKAAYCSDECRYRFRYERIKDGVLDKYPHACDNCGLLFTNYRKGSRFCSNSCSNKGLGKERAKQNYDKNHPTIDGMLMKRCCRCKELKPMMFEYYCRSSTGGDGFASRCKACVAIKAREYAKTQGFKERKKRNRAKHLDTVKAYYEKIKPQRREVERERRRRDVHFNIKNRMRSLIFSSLRRGKEGKKWSSLLGYTVDELKYHLERQFTKGMTWQRFLDGGIHIDHRIPVSAFNFTSEKDIDFKRCWAISNLQPMWAKENISKSNKILYPFQPSLGMAVSM